MKKGENVETFPGNQGPLKCATLDSNPIRHLPYMYTIRKVSSQYVQCRNVHISSSVTLYTLYKVTY